LSLEDPTALLMSETLLAPLLARYPMILDLTLLSLAASLGNVNE
jgi:hypothetical protein